MLQDLNPNVYASTCCMFVSGYFNFWACKRQGSIQHAVRLG